MCRTRSIRLVFPGGEGHGNTWQKVTRALALALLCARWSLLLVLPRCSVCARGLCVCPSTDSRRVRACAQVRAIWKWIHRKVLNDFDYFYIAGDDTILIVENFRKYLVQQQQQQQPQASSACWGDDHAADARPGGSYLSRSQGRTPRCRASRHARSGR